MFSWLFGSRKKNEDFLREMVKAAAEGANAAKLRQAIATISPDRLTGDEKYLADLALQVKAHSEELADKKSGLWLHGWDADMDDFDDKCRVVGWPNK